MIAALATALLAWTAAPAPPDTADVDLARLLPVIERRCGACHVPDGVAFDLHDADRAWDFRAAIVDAVSQRRMPPWMAEPGHQSYVGDQTLPEAERALFEQWRAAGYPRGDTAAVASVAVPLQRFSPQFEVALPGSKDHLPDQARRDDYRCFIADWPLRHEAFVTGIGVQPGNPRISHHAIVYVAGPEFAPAYRRFVADEGGSSYRCFGGPLPDRLGEPAVRESFQAEFPGMLDQLGGGQFWLAHWAPGMQGYELPRDSGIRVQPGSTLIVQMHYYTGFAPGQADPGTTIGFRHARQVRKPAMIWPISRLDWLQARSNQSLVVPPRASASVRTDSAFTGMDAYIAAFAGRELEDFEALEVHSANLHMHLIGASGTVLLHPSEGAPVTLLNVPRYLFGWQRDFYLDRPIVLPRTALAHTRLEVRCTFSNPKAEPVYGGYGSDEEMCYDFSYLALVPKTKPAATARRSQP